MSHLVRAIHIGHLTHRNHKVLVRAMITHHILRGPIPVTLGKANPAFPETPAFELTNFHLRGDGEISAQLTAANELGVKLLADKKPKFRVKYEMDLRLGTQLQDREVEFWIEYI